jgi:hypothetical protein
MEISNEKFYTKDRSELSPKEKHYYFVEKNTLGLEEYILWPKLDDIFSDKNS